MDTIEFDLDEDNNPTSVTVSLNEDRNNVLVLSNEVTVEEQGGEISEAQVTFEFDSAVDVSATDEDDAQEALEDLISEISLSGEDYDSLEVEVNGAFEITGFIATFDMDDMEVDVDDNFDLEIMMDFDENTVFNGAKFSVTEVAFEGEGEDGEDFDFSDTAETPDEAPDVTLTGGALVLNSSDVDEEKKNDNEAEFTFEIEVENEGDDDIYIAYDEINFTISSSIGSPSISNIEHDGDDLEAGDVVVIKDGDKETFIIEVFIDAAGGTSGDYEITLEDVTYYLETTGSDTAGFDGTGATVEDTTGTLILDIESKEVYLTKNV